MDIGPNKNNVRKIAIFASGSGSNAEKIIEQVSGSSEMEVSLIVCNVPGAGVINRAARFGIPVLMINRNDFLNTDIYVEKLKEHKIDFIVLAGFLWKVPDNIIKAYRNRIINIHPALLPKYGGKGMYGLNVHKAVIEAGEKESGITIHYVDEHYDNGDVILQEHCEVLPSDTPETLADRIHGLEHQYLPKVVEELVKKL